jgi:hypothetical protein
LSKGTKLAASSYFPNQVEKLQRFHITP